jgi:hypothetical protein
VDPLTADFVRAFDARWNAHDEAGILDHFTEDATVQLSPPPPAPMREVYRGRDDIAEFVGALLPGFHVESTNLVSGADAVTWIFAVSCDAFRRIGLGPATGSATARLLGEQFAEFNVVFDEATVARLAAAAGARS